MGKKKKERFQVYGSIFKTEMESGVIKMYYKFGINYSGLNRFCQSARPS